MFEGAINLRVAKKAIYILILLLLAVLLFSVAITHQFAADLPFRLIPFIDYPVVGNFMPMYLFWGSLVFLALCLIGILVVLFYPKRKTSIGFDKSEGQLTLDKKAIEGFASSCLDNSDFIAPPKVKVQMTNKKITVDISGSLKRTSGLVGKTAEFSESLTHKLENLLGVDRKVKVYVTFKDYQPDQKRTLARVE